MSPIDSQAIRSYLWRCAAVVERHEATLTRLDAALGDGDHGDNLAAGFRAVVDGLSSSGADELPGQLLRRAGYELVSSVGGASGPLYGAAFIAAGLEAAEAEEIDATMLGRMLEMAGSALARRGRCVVGDKTIYDTLGPAVDAYALAIADGADVEDAIEAAIGAGRAGMRSTRPLVARRGLALRLGERSRGHLDPGALSCFLLLRAMVPAAVDRRRTAAAAVGSSR